MSYDYLDQVIVASSVIQPRDNDSFYNPTNPNHHFGYAADGFFYVNGVVQANHPQASWFNEISGAFRGDGSHFPTQGLILLSPASLTILDQSVPTLDAHALPLWMQFLFSDMFALADNFNTALNGWSPTGLQYADGIISVLYTKDPGNQSAPSINSQLVVTLDFSQDSIYLDAAL